MTLTRHRLNWVCTKLALAHKYQRLSQIAGSQRKREQFLHRSKRYFRQVKALPQASLFLPLSAEDAVTYLGDTATSTVPVQLFLSSQSLDDMGTPAAVLQVHANALDFCGWTITNSGQGRCLSTDGANLSALSDLTLVRLATSVIDEFILRELALCGQYATERQRQYDEATSQRLALLLTLCLNHDGFDALSSFANQRPSAALSTELKTHFPVILSVSRDPRLANDLASAQVLCSTDSPLRSLHDHNDTFQSYLLVFHLLASFAPEFGSIVAERLEQDLRPLVGLGLEQKLGPAFRLKLLNDAQFDHVRYEIAVAACFSPLFDRPPSLEEELPGSQRNPDLTGEWNSQGIRVEVTVVNEDWPPRGDDSLREDIESANVLCGFIVSLNFPLIAACRPQAEHTTQLIEQLALYRSPGNRRTVTIDGLKFRQRGDKFRCATADTPITYIEFHDDREFRAIQPAVVSRSVLMAVEREELNERFPKPDGVFTTDDVPTNPLTHRSLPASKNIFDKLEAKLGQLHDGDLNIVVLGVPNEMNDNDVGYALHGGPVVLFDLSRSEYGLQSVTDARAYVTGVGPFTDPTQLDQQRAAVLQNIFDLFRPLSAVVALRIEPGSPHVELFPNPNATVRITTGQVESIVNALRKRVGIMGEALAEDSPET